MRGTFDAHLTDELHRTQTRQTLQLIEEDRTTHIHLFHQLIDRQGVVVHVFVHYIQQLGEERITRYRIIGLLRLQTHQTLTVTLLQLRALRQYIMYAGTHVFRLKRLGHIVIRTVLQSLQTTLDSRLGGKQNHRYIVRVRVLFDELR